MTDLAEIFEAKLKGLDTNFPERWALKFFHCPRKTQSSEFSCLLCGMSSVNTIRAVGKDEQCGNGYWEEIKQSCIFPKQDLCRTPVWWRKPPPESKSSLTCMTTFLHYFSESWGSTANSRLEKACQRLLLPSFCLPVLTACSHPSPCGISATHLCSAQGPPLLHTLFLSLFLSPPVPEQPLCHLSEALPPFGTGSLCHNDLFFSLHLLWVLPASTSSQRTETAS